MENHWCCADEEGCVLSMKQKFSVLLSLYKNEKPEYLRQSLESILNQTVLPDEIVLVKDGLLSDDLENVLCEYDHKSNLFRFVQFRENRGLGLALRDGVIACQNELIARMDTDDICNPERFEKQVEFFERYPNITLLGSWITEFSHDANNPDTITKLPCLHEEIVSYAKKRNPFRHMTVMFKKSAVLTSGNYRDFLWFEDYDLWVRLLQNGYRTANIPEVLVNVRADDDMFSRRGGNAYLKQEIKFMIFLNRISFLSKIEMFNNILIRTIIRLCPNSLRKIFYISFLRKKLK